MKTAIKNKRTKYVTRADIATLQKKTSSNCCKKMKTEEKDNDKYSIDSNWYFIWSRTN